mmetsp:Transcript_20736/g.52504  ORF Transcript_20736/g.52504 Transcript_20736/m.52504 type:complete len:272 (-) Transcript_20736:3543-4358(-)
MRGRHSSHLSACALQPGSCDRSSRAGLVHQPRRSEQRNHAVGQRRLERLRQTARRAVLRSSLGALSSGRCGPVRCRARPGRLWKTSARLSATGSLSKCGSCRRETQSCGAPPPAGQTGARQRARSLRWCVCAGGARVSLLPPGALAGLSLHARSVRRLATGQRDCRLPAASCTSRCSCGGPSAAGSRRQCGCARGRCHGARLAPCTSLSLALCCRRIPRGGGVARSCRMPCRGSGDGPASARRAASRERTHSALPAGTLSQGAPSQRRDWR